MGTGHVINEMYYEKKYLNACCMQRNDLHFSLLSSSSQTKLRKFETKTDPLTDPVTYRRKVQTFTLSVQSEFVSSILILLEDLDAHSMLLLVKLLF